MRCLHRRSNMIANLTSTVKNARHVAVCGSWFLPFLPRAAAGFAELSRWGLRTVLPATVAAQLQRRHGHRATVSGIRKHPCPSGSRTHCRKPGAALGYGAGTNSLAHPSTPFRRLFLCHASRRAGTATDGRYGLPSRPRRAHAAGGRVCDGLSRPASAPGRSRTASTRAISPRRSWSPNKPPGAGAG